MSFYNNSFKSIGNTQTSISRIQQEQKKIAKLDQIIISINLAINNCDSNGLQEIKSSLKAIEKRVIDKRKKLEKNIQNENQSIVNVEKSAYQAWWESLKKGLQIDT